MTRLAAALSLLLTSCGVLSARAATETTDGGTCPGLEPLLAEHSPGWDVGYMSRLAWRESRCQIGAVGPYGERGQLQVYRRLWIGEMCRRGVACTGDQLAEPEANVRAAALIWGWQGYCAWTTAYEVC